MAFSKAADLAATMLSRNVLVVQYGIIEIGWEYQDAVLELGERNGNGIVSR